MDFIRKAILASLLLFLPGLASCQAQTSKIVGGSCEGCEAIFEYENKKLTSSDTLPEFRTNDPKLKIAGTVFRKDGKTPAEGVILYIYHTNRQGLYQKRGDENGWAKRHGVIRGWVKTGKDGKYSFYTFRPVAYPNRSEPEHIHLIVKEPGKNEYYLDDYLFEDDPLLTLAIRKKQQNRGGSGIRQPKLINGTLTVERDIILGENIPHYE